MANETPDQFCPHGVHRDAPCDECAEDKHGKNEPLAPERCPVCWTKENGKWVFHPGRCQVWVEAEAERTREDC